ncbi:uncharacterized protein LOC111085779 [Limulus polyphemus]|uniref:Uncharacterized protein LOC111085779 n=1 Tax=Limulus polyphemus TaxID=6850 RepID=A0ABM1SDH8_LIMPO|nr:uncharacterized protein LOC111085779 [Limulus polyphemus]
MWRLACFLHFITSLAFFLYLLVQFARVMDPQLYGINPGNYEEGRELCGVFIIVVWLRICREVPIESMEGPFFRNFILLTFLIIFSIFPLLLWTLCYVENLRSYVGL